LTEQEQQLLDYFRTLSQQDTHALLRYAAFLAGSEAATTKDTIGQADTVEQQTDTEIPQPQFIKRPENERVVDALKRLSNSYPMLEKKTLLDKASGLVAQHIMFGKPAKDVIDEIENLFADAYDAYVKEAGRA
jgi:hypothetical protein